MSVKVRQTVRTLWPMFFQGPDEQLRPYFTFTDYRQIWILGIFLLCSTALLPLLVVTAIHHQLIQTSVDSELVLRTERLASNARRAVSFFLEERLDALQFTVNEVGYDRLADADHLAEVLRNLKLGFGGLIDLSVISEDGSQVAYAGSFHLEGKNYGKQPWFLESRKHDFYVSTIFKGYRDVPHIIAAVKSHRPDGTFFILRATLEIEKLMHTLSSYKTGEHADIFLIDRTGILQTPSTFYGETFQKLPIPVPGYSPRTRAFQVTDESTQPIIMGYAFIATQAADTPFVLMVVKQKSGMMEIWSQLRSNINGFVGSGILAIVIVITVACTYGVNKLYLTDRSKAETMVLMEQNNQLASIGQLAAGVAHEINNPLALINETAGYIRDLFTLEQKYEEDAELVEMIDTILDAIERCGTITSQLLGFSRKFDIRIEKITLGSVISDVLVFHKKEAEYRNIDISVDIPDDLPEIETDRGKLQQIVMNLVNNAFHAVNDGCHLGFSAVRGESDTVRLTISDTGCGIPPESIDKIFEPFYTTKEKGRGTGLGLPITYGLVQKLRGTISVESRENEGTTFVVTLPVRMRENLHDDKSAVGG